MILVTYGNKIFTDSQLHGFQMSVVCLLGKAEHACFDIMIRYVLFYICLWPLIVIISPEDSLKFIAHCTRHCTHDGSPFNAFS